MERELGMIYWLLQTPAGSPMPNCHQKDYEISSHRKEKLNLSFLMQNVCHSSASTRVQLPPTWALYIFFPLLFFTLLRVFLQFKFLIFLLAAFPAIWTRFIWMQGDLTSSIGLCLAPGVIIMPVCAGAYWREWSPHRVKYFARQHRQETLQWYVMSVCLEWERNYHYQLESKCYVIFSCRCCFFFF